VEQQRNLMKFDRVIVEIDDLQTISEYMDTLSEEERKQTSEMLQEAVLVVYKKGFPSTNIYFKIVDAGIDFEVCVGFKEEDTRLMAKFHFNYNTGEVETFGKWKDELKSKDIQRDLKGYVFWVSIVTLYITHTRNEEVIIEEERVKVAGKNRHKSKNVNRYTYISRKKYTIKAPSEELKQKRQVTRHVDSWSVRGHIRRLQNGKEIWVKPHIKGVGEISPKNYKITT
jgi:hypothetical protein